MSISFSVHFSDYQCLARLSKNLITGSQKAGTRVTDKIKNGFVALISSISNSSLSVRKNFSFSNADRNVSSNMEKINLELIPSKIIPHTDFDKLKSEMHARLNIFFNSRE